MILLLGIPFTSAEKYLSQEEAEKLCFPAADRFEQQVLRFEKECARKIEKAAGSSLLAKGIRVSQAWQGEQLVGWVFFDRVIGKHELIDYAVAISPEGKVNQIEILEYRESYGGEIRGKRWRDQFAGKTSSDRVELNSDIYNISGATLSCRHVTQGVKRVLAIYNLLCHDRYSASGGVPASAQSGS